jgi:hypothetical protein
MAAALFVIVRQHPTLGVLEVFLNGRERLSLPRELPARFSGRLERLFEDVYRCTRSSDYTEAPLRNRRDLLLGGVWACDRDFDARGAHPDTTEVPALVVVSGIPVEAASVRLWRSVVTRVEEAVRPARRVLAVGYHGSSADNAAGICAEGLRESDGMLGRGVYLANFWKAAYRYGLLDPKYRLRPEGAVVSRVYVVDRRDEDARIAEKGTEASEACPCDAPCGHYRMSGRIAWTRGCDHLSRWRSDESVAGVHVDPATCARDLAGKRVVNNEEWCVRRECAHVQFVSVVDPASRLGPAEPVSYDPFDRKITIE